MALKLRTPIPSLSGADAWLNSGRLTAPELAGSPVLIHFWAIGCELCKRQIPMVIGSRQELGPRGLRVVGVHTRVQATPPDTSAEDVARAARELGLEHPIAVDLSGALAREFRVAQTPAYFVFDAAGFLRHYQAGYRAEALVRAAVERVLAEREASRPEAP